MSYRLSKAAYYSQAKGKAQHILSVLGEIANDNTVTDDGTYLVGHCFPGKTYLAELTGYSPSTILRCRQELVRLGFVTYEVKGMLVNYTIKIPKAKQPNHSQIDHSQIDHSQIDHSQIDHSQIDQPTIVKLTTPPSQIDQHNREYNREDKREINKEDTNIDKTDSQSMSVVGSVLKFSKNTALEVARDAKSRIMQEGVSEDEARNKIKSVWDAFKEEWRKLEAGGFDGVKAPQKYVVGILVTMAKEGKRTMATAPAKHAEPKTFDGIMSALKEDYKTIYPDVANHIDGIFEDFAPRSIASIRAAEARGWAGISSPLSWVRTRIDGQVYSQVEAARAEELESASRALVRLRNRLAEAIWAGQNGDTSAAAQITALKAKVEQLETLLRKNAAA